MTFEQLEHFEVWHMIPSYEGLYEVSNWGRVRSVARRSSRRRLRIGKLLAPKMDKAGYLSVTLFQDRKRTHRLVHTLVAEAFIGPRPPDKHVDHGDGNRWNNMLWNLSYLTRSEDAKAAHRRRGNWSGCQPGEHHWNAKLTDAQVTDIRRLKIEGMATGAIAKLFGVHRNTIHRIISRKRRAKA